MDGRYSHGNNTCTLEENGLLGGGTVTCRMYDYRSDYWPTWPTRAWKSGNHSALHARLLNRPAAFRTDVERAQAAFQAHLGLRPELFAWPFGEYMPAWVNTLRESGFKAAVGQYSGVVYPGSPRYALPRFPMGGSCATVEGFRQKSRMRALRVADHRLRSPLLTGLNPATLELQMDTAGLNAAAVRFFVQGRPQSLQRPDPADPKRLLLRADAPLIGCRALYTPTAPSADSRAWH